MAQIPTWLWLLSGLAIIIVSKTVGGRVEAFFWIGLIFGTIGLAKLLVSYVIREPKAKEEQMNVRAGVVPAHPYSLIRFCPRCGNHVTSDAYFCSRCGLKIR
ncbi:MAG: zinc ribbon domain-containing protein [Candidatus Woesearchaeota archaeon]